MSTIDEIKARIDIVDLVSETVQLRRSGRNYTGFCPFHDNTRTPAFAVFQDSGTWRCFGQCNEGGDIFKFVMKKEGWDFAEALRFLAERAGVELKPPSVEGVEAIEEQARLHQLLEDAVTYYHHQLLHTNAGKPALEYLRQKRQLSDETIEAFGLGYAPHAWEAVLQHFRAKEVPVEDLLAVGLVTERDSGGVYDRFRNRIMIPIRNERSLVAGFGARILDPKDEPKFLNTRQTEIFDKGHLLYGLERARKSIQSENQAVIVEGYLDVIALHQAGFTNVVSPMGTALTERQLGLLKRYTRRVVLALDPDAAGDNATMKGLEIARKTLGHEQEPVFDARGLLGQESRLQADIRVSTLPDGLDPDEIVARDPKEWEKIIHEARPIVVHVMETLAGRYDLEDPKAKTEIANQVLPLIEEVPSPIERDTYRQRLARLLKVDERTLLEFRPQAPRNHRVRRPTPRVAAPPRLQTTVLSGKISSYVLEAHCLGILLRRPELLYKVDRALQESGLPRLSPVDFQHTNHQSILRLFQESVDQDLAEPLNYVMNELSLPMMEMADDLLLRTTSLDPNEDRVLEDLMRALLELRTRNLRQNLDYVRTQMDEAHQHGDWNPVEYRQSMQQYLQTLKLLNQAQGKFTSHSVTTR